MVSVASKVRQTIEQMTDVELISIELDDELEYDLELDSYSMDELIMEVEDYYDICLDSYYEKQDQIVTVRDLVRHIKKYVKDV